MKPVILGLLTFLSLTGKGVAGQAVICLDRDEMEATLIDWYQAQLSETSPRLGFDYWVSPVKGVWALIHLREDGMSCVMAKGSLPAAGDSVRPS